MAVTLDQIRQTSSAPTGGPMTLDQIKASGSAPPPPAPPTTAPAPSLLGTIGDAAKAGIAKIKEGTALTPSGQPQTQPSLVESAERGLKIGAGVADVITSPLAPIFAPVGKAVGAVTDKISDIPAVQKFAMSPGGETTARVAQDVGNATDIMGTLAGLKGGVKVAPEVPGALSDIAAKAKALTTKSEAQIEGAVLDRFNKGVKPLLPAKTTPTLATKYKEHVITAVKTIKENQSNLTFNDGASGEVVTGKTPQSLQQLSDAVEQTKSTVFKQYDALAKQTGEAGVTVPVSPIAKELESVIANKALSITNPRAIQYALDLRTRLSATGALDANTAQEVVQNYNKSLEAFYRNPTYDTASHAAIDAMVANNMRQALDAKITGLTGTQYGALKAQYGALKSIERDVIKASLRDARKNTKGLIDFTDIFSGGQLVHGILALNPGTMAQGLTAKAIATLYKHLNDPNRAIKKMFQAADKLPAIKKPSVPSRLLLPAANPKSSYLNGGRPIPVLPKGKNADQTSAGLQIQPR